ncbi:MAG: fibronectin type III domain-containing protein, partial [Haloechinothrix sp.]
LALTVPAGTSHDPFKTNRALRALQSVANADVGVEAKFDSVPSEKYQIQGLMFEAGESTFVRFDVHHNGSGLRAFASTTVNGSAKTRLSVAVPTLLRVWLRVVRSGSTWTMSYSGDGSTWTEVGSFTQAITLAKVGPFVANHGSSGSVPGYTALVDYVFDMAAPIDPEDGAEPVEDTTAPVISDVTVTPSSTSAEVTWGTNEATTGRVDYGTAAGAYGSSEASGTAGTGHSVALTGLIPETTYHFVVYATDTAGNTSVTDDAMFTTLSTSASAPVIDVWYGDTPVFGRPAQAHKWVNVHGNVKDSDGVESLTYRLNGGESKPLSMGPNKRRLQDPGDFNVNLGWEELQSGSNVLDVTAVDVGGNTATSTVTLIKEANPPLELPQQFAWSPNVSLLEQAQAVDGLWEIPQANQLRTVQLGYDRIVALGDYLNWTDFEVTVPVTVHAIGPGHNSQYSGAALVGLGLRWQGHTPRDDAQLPWGWWPTGAFAWHRFYDGGGRYELRGNDNYPVRHTTQPLKLGTTYTFKVRVETLASATRYSFKWWEQEKAEPSAWGLQIDEDAGPAAGSVALIAHHVDTTIGAVTVAPLTSP